MSTERDELAEMRGELAELTADAAEHDDDDWMTEAATAILAAGYRRPRTITTQAELDALLFEAVILDSYGTAYVCLKHAPTENQWDCPALTNENMPSWAIVDHGPFTVLHEGSS